MAAIREALTGNAPLSLALGGLLIGCLFGAVVFRTNYCAMGSLLGHLQFRRLAAFSRLAVGGRHGAVGRTTSCAGGIVALDKSMYLAPALDWVGIAMGGVVFGFGMVFAGGCPSRNLARAGAGDLRSLITLSVLGLFAYMAIGGFSGRCGRAWRRPRPFRSARKPRPRSPPERNLRASVGVANLLATLLLAGGGSSIAPRTRNFAPHLSTSSRGWPWGLRCCGLGADRPCLRRFRDSTDATGLADLYPPDRRRSPEWLQRFTAEPVPGFGVSSVSSAPSSAPARGPDHGPLPPDPASPIPATRSAICLAPP